MKRRTVIQGLAASSLAACAGIASAQQWPSRPIRLIVPFPPGGGVDNGARIFADRLRESFGQSVVVENRPGANTAIGSAVVAKAAPDGHTLLFASNGHVVLPLIADKLPYDHNKDLVPVTTLAYTPYIMIVHPSIPANTVKEFIAYAKSKPGVLNFGSSGIGGGSHMAGEVFKAMAGLDMVHIPSKGGGPAMTELMAGRVHLNFNSVNAAEPQIKGGKVKAIAIGAEQRWPTLPNIPTFAESGMPQYEERAWLGVFAPAGTPKTIIDQIHGDMVKYLKMPATRDSLLSKGLVPFIQSPGEFAKMLQRETKDLAPIVKSANIKME